MTPELESQTPASADAIASNAAATQVNSTQANAPTASETANVSARRSGMAGRMPYRTAGREKATAASAALRLHQMFGESAATWENRMYGAGSVYRRVAQINGALRVLGLLDKLTELMMPVELSLGPEGVLPLPEALHAAEIADTEEQLADESFRFKLAQGTATVADADVYLKKSALQCARAEVARREVERWKASQRKGDQ